MGNFSRYDPIQSNASSSALHLTSNSRESSAPHTLQSRTLVSMHAGASPQRSDSSNITSTPTTRLSSRKIDHAVFEAKNTPANKPTLQRSNGGHSLSAASSYEPAPPDRLVTTNGAGIAERAPGTVTQVPVSAFDCIKVDGDGDCLFQAVIKSSSSGSNLGKQEGTSDAAKLRQDLLQYVLSNESVLANLAFDYGTDINSLTKLLSTPKAWNSDAGDIVLPLLAHKIGREINVCVEGKDNTYKVIQTAVAFNSEFGGKNNRETSGSAIQEPLWVLKYGDTVRGGGTMIAYPRKVHYRMSPQQ